MERDNRQTGTSILLADGHAEVRSALRFLLEQEPDVQVYDEVSDSSDLCRVMKDVCPDIIMLDWELPGNQGGAVAAQLKQNCSHLVIIALSSNPETRKPALQAGCDGFLSKNSSPEEVIGQLGTWKELVRTGKEFAHGSTH